MAVRIAFFFILAFFLFQFATAGPLRFVRDAPSVEDAGKAIDDAVDNLKSGFQDLLKNIQNNDLMKDLQEGVQKLGDQIQTSGKELIEKIKTSGNTN